MPALTNAAVTNNKSFRYMRRGPTIVQYNLEELNDRLNELANSNPAGGGNNNNVKGVT